MSQFTLHLPDSLMQDAKLAADGNNVSLNQFFLTAISEKIGELKTRQFFEARSKGANVSEALAILDSIENNESIHPEDAINVDGDSK